MYTLKKSLGQHFLRDGEVVKRIICELRQHKLQRLLEVGPGAGALTKHIIQIAGIDFKAVELDAQMISYLSNQLPGIAAKLIHGSILEINKPFTEPFIIVGNFPYNISSQIVFKVLEWKDSIEAMLGMFQKEVAERITAKAGNKVYGVLSVLVQAFFEVQYLFEVQENAFNPPPKVKSAVIRFTPREARPAMKSEKDFFNLVKTAFNQRRKMLRNAVKGLFDANILEDPFFNKRAEEVTVDQFAELTFKMS